MLTCPVVMKSLELLCIQCSLLLPGNMETSKRIECYIKKFYLILKRMLMLAYTEGHWPL